MSEFESGGYDQLSISLAQGELRYSGRVAPNSIEETRLDGLTGKEIRARDYQRFYDLAIKAKCTPEQAHNVATVAFQPSQRLAHRSGLGKKNYL